MSVTITSTTDSDEAVTAALGETKSKAETKSAPEVKSSDETADESETLETDEIDEKESESESEADESESKDEDAQPKKKNGFKKRIDKLTKGKADAERETEYWKQQALKGQSETKPQADVKPEPSTAKEPIADDYETYGDYLKAVVRFEADERETTKERASQSAKQQVEFKSKLDSHLARVSEFKKSHSDWDELVEDAEGIVPSMAMQEIILESENGPDLLYELLNDKSEFERISKLGTIAAAREIGKIEARLSSSEPSEDKPEPKTTKAPAPISSLKSKAPAPTKDPEKMDYQEFKRFRENQIRGR